MHQETYDNFFGIFGKKLNTHRGSGSNNRGKYSKNSRRLKETTKPTVPRPKPARVGGSGSPERIRGVGLIRIQQDLNLRVEEVGRWIGSESTRSSTLYKRLLTRIPSFLSFFLFLPSSPSRSSLFSGEKNPNPSFQNLTQNSIIHGSKASLLHSKHESNIEILMHQL